MKNLQSFGVQELDAMEMKNINGGWWFVALLAVALVVGLAVGLSDKKDSCPE